MNPKDFDPLLHERVRLGILGLILQREEVDFRTLREVLQVSDGNLASHLRALEEAGVVAVEKTFAGRKPRTLYRLTPEGKTRFLRYLENLEAFLKTLKQEESS